MLKGFNVVRKKGICTMKRKGEGVVVALSPEALAMAGWPRSAKADVGVNAKARAIAVMRSRYGDYDIKEAAGGGAEVAVDALLDALDIEEGKTYEFEPAVQGKAASSRALVLTRRDRRLLRGRASEGRRPGALHFRRALRR